MTKQDYDELSSPQNFVGKVVAALRSATREEMDDAGLEHLPCEQVTVVEFADGSAILSNSTWSDSEGNWVPGALVMRLKTEGPFSDLVPLVVGELRHGE